VKPFNEVLDLVGEPLDLTAGEKVLVLFDPIGEICSNIRELGLVPVCVPDRQSGINPERVHGRVEHNYISELVKRDCSFKLAVAAPGMQRFFEVTNPSSRNGFTSWLRRCTGITLASAPRLHPWLIANELGPYRLRDEFGEFTYLSELDSSGTEPIIALSENYLWDGDRWYSDHELTEIKSNDFHKGSNCSLATPAGQGVRTFRFSDTKVIKYEVASPDYFERSQVMGEANFLQSLGKSVAQELGTPRLLSHVPGRVVVGLSREYLKGEVLGPQHAGSSDESVASLFTLATSFAEQGYFHNDIRPWNVIWQRGNAKFIDFADTARQDLDTQGIPNLVALYGTALYVKGITPRGFVLDEPHVFSNQLLALTSEFGLSDFNDEFGVLAQAWLELPLRIGQLEAFLFTDYSHKSLWGFLSGNSYA